MLDLEVVPERSLGNEQWEFILGELQMQSVHALALISFRAHFVMFTQTSILALKEPFSLFGLILSVSFLVYRNACSPVCADSQATMPCYQICTGDVQRGGTLVSPKSL